MVVSQRKIVSVLGFRDYLVKVFLAEDPPPSIHPSDATSWSLQPLGRPKSNLFHHESGEFPRLVAFVEGYLCRLGGAQLLPLRDSAEVKAVNPP